MAHELELYGAVSVCFLSVLYNFYLKLIKISRGQPVLLHKKNILSPLPFFTSKSSSFLLQYDV
jgi:hypothetical protein